MKKIKNYLKQLWSDESGQGATEYILMLVVIVAIVFAFRRPILDMIKVRTEGINDEMSKIFDAD